MLKFKWESIEVSPFFNSSSVATRALCIVESRVMPFGAIDNTLEHFSLTILPNCDLIVIL